MDIDENACTDVVLIGIMGGTCSGKSTVVKYIKEKIGSEKVLIISQDRYYLPLDKDVDTSLYNFDSPTAIEWSLLMEHLSLLVKGKDVQLPNYDFTIHNRKKETCKVSSKKFIIVEGTMIFCCEKLKNLMSHKIFINADPDVRILRRIERDIKERGRTLDSVIHQYRTTVRPSHEKYVEPHKNDCDIVIPNNDNNFKKIKNTIDEFTNEKLFLSYSD